MKRETRNRPGYFHGVTRQVVVLGWVSFFTDLASEMLYPIIPLFLTGTLGLPKEALGGIEGIAEGIATGLRWLGGLLSDWSGRRKPFVFWGYAITALAKPIMGLAAFWGGWGMFLAGRASDRFGKSIRSAARDALIADATEPAYRGIAFGVQRAMDTAGAVMGPSGALLILWLWPGTPLAYLFFLAIVPGLISAMLIAVGVHDSGRHEKGGGGRLRFFQSYPRGFWWLLAATGLFSLANSSDTFLILRATGMWAGGVGQGGGASLRDIRYATALYAGFNVVYAALSIPAGKWSDAMPRKWVMAMGWLIYAGVYAGFAAGGGAVAAWGLFLIYGVFQAFTDGVSKAYVTDLVPKGQRAGAIGLFYSISGAGQLVSSLATGALWDRVGAGWAFGACGVLAVVAIPFLLAVPGKAGNESP